MNRAAGERRGGRRFSAALCARPSHSSQPLHPPAKPRSLRCAHSSPINLSGPCCHAGERLRVRADAPHASPGD